MPKKKTISKEESENLINDFIESNTGKMMKETKKKSSTSKKVQPKETASKRKMKRVTEDEEPKQTVMEEIPTETVIDDEVLKILEENEKTGEEIPTYEVTIVDAKPLDKVEVEVTIEQPKAEDEPKDNPTVKKPVRPKTMMEVYGYSHMGMIYD